MIGSLLALLACSGGGGPVGADDTGCSPSPWYADDDGDGYGTGAATQACTAPAGHVATAGDCDDADGAVHPAATEVCDGVDNDCDGVVDPPDQAWYLDQDGDGYGGEQVQACARPEHGVEQGGDCDDADDTVYPGAPETWYDGVDGDCDGAGDYDADGDGYSVDVLTDEDCDDGDPTVHPGATDVCDDGRDTDCDGEEEPCAPVGVLEADDIETVFLADGDFERLGLSVVTTDDSDADGFPELWIGAPWAEGDSAPDDSGRLFRVDVRDRIGMTASNAAEVTINGGVASGYLGQMTSVTGDFDGDGWPDLFANDIRVLPDTSVPSGQGALYFGPLASELEWADADVVVESANVAQVFYGFDDLAVLATEDGRDLLVIAAPWSEVEGYGRGQIFLVDLADGGTVDLAEVEVRIAAADESVDQFGEDLVVADLDGDGVDDAVSSVAQDSTLPGGSRKAALLAYRGPFEGIRDMADYDALRTNGPLPGGVGSDQLGKALALLPDLDGDGLPDLLVGAPLHESHGDVLGAAYVYPGPITGERLGSAEQDFLLRIVGDEDAHYLGQEVASAGDMDGDGKVDLVVGTNPGHDTPGLDEGYALVFYGPSTGGLTASDADLRVVGLDQRPYGGPAMSGGHDLDQDGFDDLVLGSWAYDDEDAGGPPPPYPDDPTGYDGAVFVVFGGPED